MGEKAEPSSERGPTATEKTTVRPREGISLVSSSLSPMEKQGRDKSLISCIPIGNSSAFKSRSWSAYYKPDGRDAAQREIDGQDAA